MIGIVLAGGLATRLPNKPLLPLRSGKPVITSSLDLFVRSGVKKTIVVITPNSVIPYVLGGTHYDGMILEYATQTEATGVPHAMTHAVVGREKDETYVMSCCDNVYGLKEKIETLSQPPCVNVRCESPSKAIHLAKCNVVDWRWFNDPYDFNRPCVAGWMIFKQCHIMQAKPGMITVDFLNLIGAQPITISEDYEWWDVGTPETYFAYWRHGSV